MDNIIFKDNEKDAEFTIKGKQAGKIALIGESMKFKAGTTDAKKKSLAKLADMGVTTYQQCSIGDVVFTTHDKALIEAIKTKSLGEIDFIVQAKKTGSTNIRLNVTGWLTREASQAFDMQEAQSKWLSIQTYKDNPEFLEKIGDINALMNASA